MTFVLLVIWRHIFYECLDKITFLYVVPSVVLVHLVWWVQTSSDVSSSHSVCLQELCFCKRVKNTFNTFIIWGRSFGTLFRVSFPSGVRYRQNSPCHLSSHLLSPRRSTRHTRPCCRTCWRWPGRSPPCRAHTDRRKSQRPRRVAGLCRAGLTWADGTRLRRQNKGGFSFFHLLPGFSFVYFLSSHLSIIAGNMTLFWVTDEKTSPRLQGWQARRRRLPSGLSARKPLGRQVMYKCPHK